MSDLRDMLLEIRSKHGILTPSVVLEEARDVAHPLHPRFNWDDASAAEHWRQAQAHELIRSVRVVKGPGDQGTSTLRYFHAVRSEVPENGGFVYDPLDEIAEDDFKSQIVLRDMEREWKTLRKRYGHFKQFVELVRKDVGAA